MKTGATDTRRRTYSAVTHRGFKRVTGMRVRGESAVLQAPKSATKLYIPEGLDAYVSGTVHTDPTPFLHAIPLSECLISPIVEYHLVSDDKSGNIWFKIKVPHCLRKWGDLKSIKVRHGDIYKSVPFTELPSSTCRYEVDLNYINIHTQGFSQFICTSCKKTCQAETRVFVFGSLSPLVESRPITAALRLYLTSTLFKIQDYNQVSSSVGDSYEINKRRDIKPLRF